MVTAGDAARQRIQSAEDRQTDSQRPASPHCPTAADDAGSGSGAHLYGATTGPGGTATADGGGAQDLASLTAKEIEEAGAVDTNDLPDPETDGARAAKPEMLVLVGVCTHLGCVPLGQKATDPRGEWGGWFCPCHGSHYDTSGRIRKGPAPTNLPVPPYEYISDTVIRIG